MSLFNFCVCDGLFFTTETPQVTRELYELFNPMKELHFAQASYEIIAERKAVTLN
jgi:hypothetical protein